MLSSRQSRAAGLGGQSPASAGYLGRSTDALSSMKLAGDGDLGVISLKGPRKPRDSVIYIIHRNAKNESDAGPWRAISTEPRGRSQKVPWNDLVKCYGISIPLAKGIFFSA